MGLRLATVPARPAPGRAAVVPGLVVCLALAWAAVAAGDRWSSLSPLVVALLAGVVLGNLRPAAPSTAPGFRFSSRTLLRLGVALLGFRLVSDELWALGPDGIVLVAAGAGASFLLTLRLARVLHVPRTVGVLTATGFAICGASAIAAMCPVVDADEDETAFPIALVTLFGSVAVLVLPLLTGLVGMADDTSGAWIGASVHDVGQVVAASSVVGGAAVQWAIVVKLARVLLLAPLLALVSIVERRARPRAGRAAAPAVPWFVVAFVACATFRNVIDLSGDTLATIDDVGTFLLATAMVAMGAGVRVAGFRRLGVRPLVLGLAAWIGILLITLPAAAWLS